MSTFRRFRKGWGCVFIVSEDTIAGFAREDDFWDLSEYVVDLLTGAAQAEDAFVAENVKTSTVRLTFRKNRMKTFIWPQE